MRQNKVVINWIKDELQQWPFIDSNPDTTYQLHHKQPKQWSSYHTVKALFSIEKPTSKAT